MNNATLQVPMSKKLKKEAEDVSRNLGFSSLQEVVRVLLTKWAKKELTITVQETDSEEIVDLSPTAKKRYTKALEEIRAGKNMYKPKDTGDLLKWLRE